MKYFKYFLFLLISLSITFYIESEPKYLFKIASDAPDGSIWINSIRDINKAIGEKTKGDVGVRVYPSGVMGDQSAVLKKIKIGQLNGSTFSSGGLGLIYKDFGIMGFPMIFKSYEEYDYVKDKMSSFFEKKFEENGFVLMAWSEVGLIYLFSKYRVNSVEALRFSKPLLIEGDSISLALFNEINASPVPLQIPDVITGLQTGLIDTVFSSPYTLIVTQWFTKVNYMADAPITLMIGGILVEKNTFDKMPANYKKDMKELFKTTFDNLNGRVREDNKNALVSLKKNGLMILPVAKTDYDLFITVCNRLADRLTKEEYSRATLDNIRMYLNEFRNK